MFSRAYISFTKPEDILAFSQSYDGHVFRDKQGSIGFKHDHPDLPLIIPPTGNEYRAVVEYAPFQKTPAPPKVDSRQGTVEEGDRIRCFR